MARMQAEVRDVTDVRIHGTTGEAPAERFIRDELVPSSRLPALRVPGCCRQNCFLLKT